VFLGPWAGGGATHGSPGVDKNMVPPPPDAPYHPSKDEIGVPRKNKGFKVGNLVFIGVPLELYWALNDPISDSSPPPG